MPRGESGKPTFLRSVFSPLGTSRSPAVVRLKRLEGAPKTATTNQLLKTLRTVFRCGEGAGGPVQKTKGINGRQFGTELGAENSKQDSSGGLLMSILETVRTSTARKASSPARHASMAIQKPQRHQEQKLEQASLGSGPP